MSRDEKIKKAQEFLCQLGMDNERSNERSAMVFLALAGLGIDTAWGEASNNMYGTRAIMDWISGEYGVEYKPNTRETIRRFTLHQFVQAGIVIENADDPLRPINSPKWNYKITDEVLELLQKIEEDGFT